MLWRKHYFSDKGFEFRRQNKFTHHKLPAKRTSIGRKENGIAGFDCRCKNVAVIFRVKSFLKPWVNF